MAKWKVALRDGGPGKPGMNFIVEAENASSVDNSRTGDPSRGALILIKENKAVFLAPLDQVVYAICLTDEIKSEG